MQIKAVMRHTRNVVYQLGVHCNEIKKRFFVNRAWHELVRRSSAVPAPVHTYSMPLDCAQTRSLDSLDWYRLLDYANKCNLFLLSDTEIKDWIQLHDHGVHADSIHVRFVNCCGQKYITYLSYHAPTLHQFVIVRGTRNWKNVQTSLKYQMNYNDHFQMRLHSGYGSASYAVLQDVLPFIHPAAQLNLLGHSYGGVVSTLMASYFKQQALNPVNQVVTFGMPQFSTPEQMRMIGNELPITQVQHVRDHIAKFHWHQADAPSFWIKNASSNYTPMHCSSVVPVGMLDYFPRRSLKRAMVHRMGDYIRSIENQLS